MTKGEFDELRRLEAEATAGPWWIDENYGTWRAGEPGDSEEVAEFNMDAKDEALLLAMRNALPALLDLAAEAMVAREFFREHDSTLTTALRDRMADTEYTGATEANAELGETLAALEKLLPERAK